MAFSFRQWFGGKGKRPSVTYSRDQKGNHLYKLTDHDTDHFRSCLVGGYSEANMITLYETIPEVFAPVNEIANRVPNGVFQLKKITTDEVVHDNRFWNALMERPNWLQSWEEFVKSGVVYKILCGNRYMYTHVADILKKKLETISSIWWLPSQYTEPHLRSDRPVRYVATDLADVVDYYQVSTPGEALRIKPELVVHNTSLSFGQQVSNPLKGISQLRAVEYPMSNLIAVYQARNIIYVKHGALGFLVSKTADATGAIALTEDQKEQLREDVQSTYGITGGRAPFGITDVPVDFVRVSMSIEELQPFEETYSSAAAIYGVLGVPRSFIPTKDGPTYTNGPADERKLYQDVVIKHGKEFCSIINRALNLSEAGLYVDVSYDHIEVLQEDKKSKAETDKIKSETALAQYRESLLTKNQLLVAIGQEEIGRAGDVYISDGKNPDPLAVKLGVGGVTALQGVLLSALPSEVKKNVLIIVFGVPEGDAAKMISDGTITSEN